MGDQKQFSGLWAIILGGSSGMGFASVEKLARHGMNVAALYRETSVSEKLLLKKFQEIALQNSIEILPYNINALDASARESFIEDFGKKTTPHTVKLLLHSIARGNLRPLVVKDPGPDEVNKVLSIEDIQITSYAMSHSLLDWTRSLLQAKLFHTDGRIIGLTSEGAYKHWDSYAAVSIAKSSLESLAKYMAVEFSVYGLKTNLIQAGITETPALKMIPGSEALIKSGIERNPFGRMTKPEDVANAIYLLCTDEASWINGTILHVDGGEHCR